MTIGIHDPGRRSQHRVLADAFLFAKMRAGAAMTEEKAITGYGLVALLGWCVDDFEAEARKASPEVLRDCLKILKKPDPPGTPERITILSEYGVRFVTALLRTWAMNQLMPEKPKGPNYMWPGDPRGQDWGFTEIRWAGSFLVLEGDRVICATLHAAEEGKGYFRRLMKGIEASGYRVSVPVPMAQMREILVHYGFKPRMETSSDGHTADVWEKPVGGGG